MNINNGTDPVLKFRPHYINELPVPDSLQPVPKLTLMNQNGDQ